MTGAPTGLGSDTNGLTCHKGNGLAIVAGQNITGDMNLAGTGYFIKNWDSTTGTGLGVTGNEISNDGVIHFHGHYEMA